MIAYLWLFALQWAHSSKIAQKDAHPLVDITPHTQSARVVSHCDNQLTVYRKQGNGNWVEIGQELHWTNPWEFTVIPVTPATKLQFVCKDVGGIGGFIASIHYGGNVYSTMDPIANTNFVITEGNTHNLKYLPKTSGPWNIRTEGIADNAQWLWPNGETYNTLKIEFSFDLPETPEQCYFLEGNAGIIWGDPHTTTFAGVKHDYQGLPQNGLDQFFYIHPCAGSDHNDLPYHMIGRHFPYRGSTKVSGFDYMVLELFDDNNVQYNLFFSSAFHEYAQSTNTDYDTVEGLTTFNSGTTTTIGNRFSVHYIQNDVKTITVTLTVDNHCKLHFTMIGQYDYSSSLGRYTMHYVRVNPPDCYKCAICGLFGDFQGKEMQTCDGQGTVTYGGYTNAWDTRGWTWETTYTNNHCSVDSTPTPAEPYEPEPDPTFPYDACSDVDSAIRQLAEEKCVDARNRHDVNECCGEIGSVFCEDLMQNCAFDACFTSGEDENEIPTQVEEILVSPIISECGTLMIDEDNYEEFVTKSPTDEPTPKPTTPVPTSSITCCKDQMTEQECLDNYLSGKPCTWLEVDAPLAIKFNTQCLGASLVANGPMPPAPSDGEETPVIDVCHPEEFDAERHGRREAVDVSRTSNRMYRYTPQFQIVLFLCGAAILLLLGGLSLLCRKTKEDRYEPVSDPIV